MEDARSPYFDAAPPLAWMAGFAALADLILNRIWVPSVGAVSSTATLSQLNQAGAFARNLSVVGALVALSFCLVAVSSRKSGLPFSARAGVASFGWVLVPMVTAMTFLPRGLMRPELVLAVAGLAHALIFLLILAGIHWRSTPATTAALVLTLVASFSGIVSMIVRMVGERAYWQHADRLSNAFRWSGELAYLAVPIAVGFAIAIPMREARGKVVLFLSGLAAAGVAVGMSVWNAALGAELPTLLYGATRLSFLPDEHSLLYAIPLGVGWAVTVAAMLSKDRLSRQMGAAMLLLLSAGYAPRSPSTMIVTVLGVALLSRAGIALAHRRQRG